MLKCRSIMPWPGHFLLVLSIIPAVYSLSDNKTNKPLSAPRQKLAARARNVPINTVVFDLGGVLFDTDALSAFWHIGPMAFLRHPTAMHNPRSAKQEFFALLQAARSPSTPQTGVYDADGDQLPPLMVEWLTGAYCSCAAREQAIRAIEAAAICPASRAFFKGMAQLIFTPELFAKSRKKLAKGVKLLKHYKECGYSIYVLSNWDSESFALLKKRFATLFALFDGYCISGDVGVAKPDLRIFDKLIQKYPSIDPRATLFIDDQKENIEAAHRFGMHAVLFVR